MDTGAQGATATAIGCAFALPEIVALIVSHLLPADILACSAVSSVLRESFAPFVWQDLCFGPPWPPNRDVDPSRRISCESLPDVIPHITVQNRREARNQILTTFRNVAPLIRTLTIRNHESIFPLQLGAACSQLQSLDISGSFPEDTTPAHWINCKMMMRRNRDHLRSLSLLNWTYDCTVKPPFGQPNWSPILGCTNSLNLQSLSLDRCSIRGRHMAAFWTVCLRLVSLSMVNVLLHLDLPHPPPTRRNKRATSIDKQSDISTIDMATKVRFPHLKALKIEDIPEPHPLHQIDLLVSQCPALRTLEWAVYRNKFPLQYFTERLMSSTWPELDAIEIHAPDTSVTDDQIRGILLASKQRLRRLEISQSSMTLETFDIYRTRHFSTLETINITRCQGNTSTWTIEILTSCPSLRVLRTSKLHAEDILGSNKPWICHGLQELVVFIDMGFPNRGPYRRFTEDELGKCRAVFKQLAILNELQILDMLNTYPPFLSHEFTAFGRKPLLGDHLVPLPLRLKAGLDMLKMLSKLRTITFWSGRHDMPMKELNWMVRHWRGLEYIAGGWVVLSLSIGNGMNYKVHLEERATFLRGHGIGTTMPRYLFYKLWDRVADDYQDCCGLDDEDDESV